MTPIQKKAVAKKVVAKKVAPVKSSLIKKGKEAVISKSIADMSSLEKQTKAAVKAIGKVYTEKVAPVSSADAIKEDHKATVRRVIEKSTLGVVPVRIGSPPWAKSMTKAFEKEFEQAGKKLSAKTAATQTPVAQDKGTVDKSVKKPTAKKPAMKKTPAVKAPVAKVAAVKTVAAKTPWTLVLAKDVTKAPNKAAAKAVIKAPVTPAPGTKDFVKALTAVDKANVAHAKAKTSISIAKKAPSAVKADALKKAEKDVVKADKAITTAEKLVVKAEKSFPSTKVASVAKKTPVKTVGRGMAPSISYLDDAAKVPVKKAPTKATAPAVKQAAPKIDLQNIERTIGASSVVGAIPKEAFRPNTVVKKEEEKAQPQGAKISYSDIAKTRASVQKPKVARTFPLRQR